MCLQKAVATRYIELTTSDPVRLKLDRSGMSLVSGGDEDMARTSHSLGLATGLFPKLSLIHLIPPRRLELDYLLRLVEGQSYSGIVLNHLYKDTVQPPLLTNVRHRLGTLRRRLLMSGRDRLFFEARLNGQQRALRDLATIHRCQDKTS
jgi:hypothetical protein